MVKAQGHLQRPEEGRLFLVPLRPRPAARPVPHGPFQGLSACQWEAMWPVFLGRRLSGLKKKVLGLHWLPFREEAVQPLVG